MTLKQIDHELDEHRSAVFMKILARNYDSYDCRPSLCRIAVLDFEDVRYIATTDGYTGLFLPVDKTLPVGDYEGVPYMVAVEDNNPLCCMITNNLLVRMKDHPQMQIVDSTDDGNHCFAFEDRKHYPGAETEVMLAHVKDDKFVFVMDEPHQVIIDRAKYEFAVDAIGFFNSARYSAPDKQVAFMNDHGRGFAIIMPLVPSLQIRRVVGG